MMPLLALLGGPVGRIGGVLFLLVALGGGATALVRQHDARVRAEMNAAALEAQRAAEREIARRTIEGLSEAVRQAEARAVRDARTRGDIHAAPRTTACVGSPAVAAVVRGLRGAGRGDDGAQADHPGGAVGMPPATGAAAGRQR